MRKKLIQSHMEHVDLFVAPSAQLRDRYVDWGIPTEKIKVEEYGRLPLDYVPANPRRKKRNRFGFFGQFSHYKGVNVVLQAAKRLAEDDVDATIYLHGANLEIQPPEFQEEFAELLEESGDRVVMIGRYDHDRARSPDGERRLRPGSLALVGELAAGDPGGLHARPAGDLQQHRRHGGEGRATASTASISGSGTPRTWPG